MNAQRALVIHDRARHRDRVTMMGHELRVNPNRIELAELTHAGTIVLVAR